MAESFGCPVRDLLPTRLRDLDDVVRREVKDNADLAGVGGMVVGIIGGKVAGAVRESLDVDAIELLAGAWATASELEAYADPSLHPAGERSTLSLAGHDVTYRAYPTARVKVGGLGVLTLRFTLELEARFKLAEITVCGGRIVEVGKCECVLSARLKYREAALHKARIKTFVLAGPLRLAEPGLPIPVPQRAPA